MPRTRQVLPFNDPPDDTLSGIGHLAASLINASGQISDLRMQQAERDENTRRYETGLRMQEQERADRLGQQQYQKQLGLLQMSDPLAADYESGLSALPPELQSVGKQRIDAAAREDWQRNFMPGLQRITLQQDKLGARAGTTAGKAAGATPYDAAMATYQKQLADREKTVLGLIGQKRMDNGVERVMSEQEARALMGPDPSPPPVPAEQIGPVSDDLFAGMGAPDANILSMDGGSPAGRLSDLDRAFLQHALQSPYARRNPEAVAMYADLLKMGEAPSAPAAEPTNEQIYEDFMRMEGSAPSTMPEQPLPGGEYVPSGAALPAKPSVQDLAAKAAQADMAPMHAAPRADTIAKTEQVAAALRTKMDDLAAQMDAARARLASAPPRTVIEATARAELDQIAQALTAVSTKHGRMVSLVQQAKQGMVSPNSSPGQARRFME